VHAGGTSAQTGSWSVLMVSGRNASAGETADLRKLRRPKP
jgi:hypothetical protein